MRSYRFEIRFMLCLSIPASAEPYRHLRVIVVFLPRGRAFFELRSIGETPCPRSHSSSCNSYRTRSPRRLSNKANSRFGYFVRIVCNSMTACRVSRTFIVDREPETPNPRSQPSSCKP